MKKKTYNTFIVPTGIGAKIGGFAGDAGAFARKLAKDSPLIVNPNVVNAACFSAITDNMLYTEGYSITEFFKGNISLQKSSQNKIGVIFDKAISKDVLNIHIRPYLLIHRTTASTIRSYSEVSGCSSRGFQSSCLACRARYGQQHR